MKNKRSWFYVRLVLKKAVVLTFFAFCRKQLHFLSKREDFCVWNTRRTELSNRWKRSADCFSQSLLRGDSVTAFCGTQPLKSRDIRDYRAKLVTHTDEQRGCPSLGWACL